MKITDEEYRAEIQSLAVGVREEAQERAKDKGEDLHDELHDVLHEVLDRHQWIIWTAYHYEVLALSENSGAYVDELGADGLVKDGQLNTAALAYMALRADVSALLPAYDDDDN